MSRLHLLLFLAYITNVFTNISTLLFTPKKIFRSGFVHSYCFLLLFFHFQVMILISLRVLTTFSLLSISIGTSKRWYPFRPSKTESYRNCTDSFVPSKTKGRVCLPPCPEPHLFPQHLLSSLLVGTGQPKSSSGPGLTLTWIITELRTPVRLSSTLSLSLSFFCCFLSLCYCVLYLFHLGIQQSSSFSGSEQSRLPQYCNPDHHTSLSAKRGMVSY